MIDIINPGFFTIVVDGGRLGLGATGIPSSSALDLYAYQALQYLISGQHEPVLEVIGRKFTLKFGSDMTCAITGAQVQADLDGEPVRSWTAFKANLGSVLRIRDVREGFRYYLGFSGLMNVEKVIGSYATNVECRFGGFEGRSLKAGDRIGFRKLWDAPPKLIPDHLIPSLKGPHELRVLEGPEAGYFKPLSAERFWGKKDPIRYTVSPSSGRSGIRLEGDSLAFRKGLESSIISEGILPGTIQISGDGLPLIVLYERTIGGYARICVISRADRDRLAHLGPGDAVTFKKISLKQAGTAWRDKSDMLKYLSC